jgi:hypothetical protein
MKPFYDLTDEENKQLLLLPVYITLKVLSDGKEDEKNAREAAVRFAHTKTFSCDPLLIPFYREVDKNFEQSLENVHTQLPKEKMERKTAIENELRLIDRIVYKLDEQYVEVIHRSMKSFGEHVAKTQNNVISNFVFPMPMPGFDI